MNNFFLTVVVYELRYNRKTAAVYQTEFLHPLISFRQRLVDCRLEITLLTVRFVSSEVKKKII